MQVSPSDSTYPPEHRPRAIIIGGGIAGCALGLFLARKSGFRVSIFEAYPEAQARKGSIGGGLQVAPNGMRVLHQLGLAERLQELGVPSSAFLFKTNDGRSLARMVNDPDGRYDQPAVLMTRAALHQVLMDAVENEEHVAIEFDKRLVDVAGLEEDRDEAKEEEGQVEVRFEDGSTALGDLVIGADGAHSRMRGLILGADDPKAHFLGIVSLGGFVHTDHFVDRPETTHGDINFLFAPTGGTLGFCRAKGDDPRLFMWWRNMQLANHPQLTPEHNDFDGAPTKEELQAIDTEHLKRCILHLPAGDQWAPEAREMVENTDSIVRGLVYDVITLPRWSRGRACLIGDAAHAVSPHSGQGASLALEDAMYLAKMLRLAMQEHRNSRLPTSLIERAFKGLENGRRERVEMVVAEGRARGEQRKPAGAKPDEEAPGAFKRWLTERFLALVFTYLAPRQMTQLFGYKSEWDDVKSLGEVEEQQRNMKASWWRRLVK